MSQGSLHGQLSDVSGAERMSALMDGEWTHNDPVSTGLFGPANGQPSADDKQHWMLYHLLGDALRSDELASSPVAAQRFSESFSARFASEPPIVSPMSASARANAGASWRDRQTGFLAGRWAAGRRMVPSFAAAAAVATLAWVLVPQMHGGVPGTGSSGLGGLAATSLADKSVAQNGWQQVNLSADRQLDPYMAAHQQFASDRGGLAYAGLTSSEH